MLVHIVFDAPVLAFMAPSKFLKNPKLLMLKIKGVNEPGCFLTCYSTTKTLLTFRLPSMYYCELS